MSRAFCTDIPLLLFSFQQINEAEWETGEVISSILRNKKERRV